jgi:hypothetical protein
MGYHMLPHVTTNGKGIYHGRSEWVVLREGFVLKGLFFMMSCLYDNFMETLWSLWCLNI